MTTEEMVEIAKRREADKADLLEWTEKHISELIESDMDQILSVLKLIKSDDQLLKRFVDSSKSISALDHLATASRFLKTVEKYYNETLTKETV